ncbi:hypothetical protein ACQ0MK_20410 [Thalassospira lucentensis]|uniref:hypothetical protein n=1 Tax=Thalassospira lucentensis TaxID=168935 RepID=UPI003D2EAC2F
MKDPYFWIVAASPPRETARKFRQKVVFVQKMVKKTQTALLFALLLSSEDDHLHFQP